MEISSDWFHCIFSGQLEAITTIAETIGLHLAGAFREVMREEMRDIRREIEAIRNQPAVDRENVSFDPSANGHSYEASVSPSFQSPRASRRTRGQGQAEEPQLQLQHIPRRTCPVCRVTFEMEKDCLFHKLKVCMRPFACEICDKVYVSDQGLRVHKRRYGH